MQKFLFALLLVLAISSVAFADGDDDVEEVEDKLNIARGGWGRGGWGRGGWGRGGWGRGWGYGRRGWGYGRGWGWY